MRKKGLFLVLIWVAVAGTVLTLYLTREKATVKEFIAWALSIWQILAVLFTIAIAVSGWVIKHNFSPKVSTLL